MLDYRNRASDEALEAMETDRQVQVAPTWQKFYTARPQDHYVKKQEWLDFQPKKKHKMHQLIPGD